MPGGIEDCKFNPVLPNCSSTDSESFRSAANNSAILHQTVQSSHITSITQNSDQHVHPALFNKLESLRSAFNEATETLREEGYNQLVNAKEVEDFCGGNKIKKKITAKIFGLLMSAAMPLCTGYYQPDTQDNHTSTSLSKTFPQLTFKEPWIKCRITCWRKWLR
jgi:ribosomal protein L16 Arg81 hydroxylase